jgi:hypothetical protein
MHLAHGDQRAYGENDAGAGVVQGKYWSACHLDGGGVSDKSRYVAFVGENHAFQQSRLRPAFSTKSTL